MFEHNEIDEFDLKMRSILESGQEEVPAGLWEGVSAGLDKAARRRRVASWLRYSGIAVAAAAAVAVGFIFNRSAESDFIQAGQESLIAVVEETETENETILPETKAATVAEIINVTSAPKNLVAMAETVRETNAGNDDLSDLKAEVEPQVRQPEERPDRAERADIDTYYDETEWKEESPKKRIKVSLAISGIAGTNSPQNTGGLKPLKSPGIFKDPVKTTIEHVGDQTTYGIPVSAGLGIKINFTDRWALGVGVNYSLLTSRFNGKYTEVNNGVSSMPISERVKNTQHYIGIPVNAYYNIVRRDFINFYAYAGGTVEKCVGNLYQIQTTPVINHSEPVRGVQISANAGIGVEFLVGKYVGIYLDPNLRYYFKCNQPQSIRTAQPLMLGFEAGVRFHL